MISTETLSKLADLRAWHVRKLDQHIEMLGKATTNDCRAANVAAIDTHSNAVAALNEVIESLS